MLAYARRRHYISGVAMPTAEMIMACLQSPFFTACHALIITYSVSAFAWPRAVYLMSGFAARARQNARFSVAEGKSLIFTRARQHEISAYRLFSGDDARLGDKTSPPALFARSILPVMLAWGAVISAEATSAHYSYTERYSRPRAAARADGTTPLSVSS